MNSGINYRGYTGSIEFSEEDAVFHGKVIGIKSTISFEGDCAQTLTEDFHKAIDEYIEHCEKVGVEPEKPFKGSFNVRITPELHRTAVLTAAVRGMSLNAFVESAISKELSHT